jgi:hypothetical protein
MAPFDGAVEGIVSSTLMLTSDVLRVNIYGSVVGSGEGLT